MRQRFDAGLELDEGAEVGDARDAAGPHLADGVGRRRRRPRIVLQLLQAERDLLRGLVDPQHLDGDLIADGDHLAGAGEARPAHLGDVEQALDAAAEIDEGAEVLHRGDPAGQDRARDDRLAQLRRLRLLLDLEVLAARDDEVLAAVLVLDDAEGVGLALVHRRILGAGDVDLRERAEGALAGDADLVAALDRLLDLAFDGQPGVERVLELALGGGVADALARQHDAAAGRHDHRLDAVADRDLDVALVVLQLLDVDLGLALAADADEGHLRPEAGDDALDGLAPLEPARLDRRLEHRREIFFLLAHCLLLGTGTPAIIWAARPPR